eukprot:COSAG02_NODE_2742_length_8122_cov_34.555472_6_plen_56_part_00
MILTVDYRNEFDHKPCRNLGGKLPHTIRNLQKGGRITRYTIANVLGEEEEEPRVL